MKVTDRLDGVVSFPCVLGILEMIIIASALDSSATNGGPSCGRQLSCLFGLVLSIALCMRTIHRLRRLNEEK